MWRGCMKCIPPSPTEKLWNIPTCRHLKQTCTQHQQHTGRASAWQAQDPGFNPHHLQIPLENPCLKCWRMQQPIRTGDTSQCSHSVAGSSIRTIVCPRRMNLQRILSIPSFLVLLLPSLVSQFAALPKWANYNLPLTSKPELKRREETTMSKGRRKRESEVRVHHPKAPLKTCSHKLNHKVLECNFFLFEGPLEKLPYRALINCPSKPCQRVSVYGPIVTARSNKSKYIPLWSFAPKELCLNLWLGEMDADVLWFPNTSVGQLSKGII